MTGGIAVTLGLIFLFILMVDYPFKAEFSISNDQIAALPPTFQKLDQMRARRVTPQATEENCHDRLSARNGLSEIQHACWNRPSRCYPEWFLSDGGPVQ